MHKWFQSVLIAVFLILANPLSTLAQGEVFLDLQPDPQTDEIDYYGLWEEYLAEVQELDRKLPGTEVEEDFKDLIRDRHPGYSDSAVTTKEGLLRWGVRAKRIYSLAKDKVQKFLADEDLPLNLDDSQYESGKAETYIESPDNTPVVITDFKKIISYADSETDRAASFAKGERDRGEADEALRRREEFKQALVDRDWKKIFSYGLFDETPDHPQPGIGEWAGNDKIRARIYTAQTAVGDSKIVAGALYLRISRGMFLLSEGYQQLPNLKLDLSRSENLAAFTPNWPLPVRFNLNLEDSLVGYVGDIIVPFTAEVKDANLPLKLKASLEAGVCGNNECDKRKLAPQITLASGAAQPSKVASWLKMLEDYAPAPQLKGLKINRAVAESSVGANEPPVLRIEFTAKENPVNFDVFVASPDEIQFARPLIRIDGSKVVARFRAKDSAAVLDGKTFTVAARLRPELSVRQTVVAETAPLFDLESRSLNLGLVWLGFLGGFLLNLMPCVFPVLSLKLMSFRQLKGLDKSGIRRGFLYNLLGILASFVVMTAVLVCLKLLGRAIGWGMQFQNVYFLTFIIFVVAAFLAHVWGFFSFRVPAPVERAMAVQNGDSRLQHFLTGLFLVLLSTPCTAPYLGTALGFALAGNVTDIIIMMTAVGLGLSIPYLLIALFPALVRSIPAAGIWTERVNLLMAAMLALTLVWLLSILYAQTGGALTFHFILFIAVFWFILWFRRLLMEIVDQQQESAELLTKVRRFFNVIISVLAAVIFTAALFDAGYYYRVRRSYVKTTAVSKMVSAETIRDYLRDGQIVLVRIGADWCLTCVYNDVALFNTPTINEFLEANNVKRIDVDWTHYNPEVLNFMEQYGRRGLPFYIVFSPRIPDGIVLPELISDRDFRELIENLRY